MTRFVSGLVSMLLFLVIFSFGSLPATAQSQSSSFYKPISKIPNANVIGTLKANFESNNDTHSSQNKRHNEEAYYALLEAARSEYSGTIDIADISWLFIKREKEIYKFTASGKVISLGDGRSKAEAIEDALKKAIEEISKNLSPKMRIAIISMTASEKGVAEFITGELEHILIQKSYVIVDRIELDRVRAEQRLGVSGEINDNTAARIGKIAGASVVITGRVDGEGELKRLRLRALDTTSGQVIGTVSEKL